MNREEAENFIYQSYMKAQKFQDYQEKDAEKRHPELTREILRQKAGTPCTVVTGSKGKGSVANMISQILQSKYKVGLMTSPHLVDFCERFQVNGTKITGADFAEEMTAIQPEIDKIDQDIPSDVCISPMGIQADLALSFFQHENTDFNVFECGKGAKYDDVNNILHDYGVINSIFLEHTRELGDTVEDIAEDKSHIITGEQKCVYVADQEPGVMNVIDRRGSKYNVPIKRYGRDFRADNVQYASHGMEFDVIIGSNTYRNIKIPLLGEHQARNCALAMALCQDVLTDMDIETIKGKLLELNWPGRMEVLSTKPFVILDACINGASCENVKEIMKQLKIKKATVIIGIPDDKDYKGVAREMKGVTSTLLLTKSKNPHYRFTPLQQAELRGEGISSIWTESTQEALMRAQEKQEPIFILGTTSVVSEFKKMQLNGEIVDKSL